MESAEVLLGRAIEARRAGQYGEARDDAEAAESIARHSGTSEELARVLKFVGQIDRDQHRTEAARAKYEEAAGLYRTIGDRSAVAHTIRHLGEMHTEAGRLEEADACLTEALDLYRAEGVTNGLDLANTLRPTAILREAQERHDEARKLWREARALYLEAGIQEGVLECDEHLARLTR
jgi:tetratricopeptide (TPR) repeat protein